MSCQPSAACQPTASCRRPPASNRSLASNALPRSKMQSHEPSPELQGRLAASDAGAADAPLPGGFYPRTHKSISPVQRKIQQLEVGGWVAAGCWLSHSCSCCCFAITPASASRCLPRASLPHRPRRGAASRLTPSPHPRGWSASWASQTSGGCWVGAGLLVWCDACSGACVVVEARATGSLVWQSAQQLAHPLPGTLHHPPSAAGATSRRRRAPRRRPAPTRGRCTWRARPRCRRSAAAPARTSRARPGPRQRR